MKHYQTPETSVLQVENDQTLCASVTPGLKLDKLEITAAAGWDWGE